MGDESEKVAERVDEDFEGHRLLQDENERVLDRHGDSDASDDFEGHRLLEGESEKVSDQ